jgi:hypothetical protein
MSGLISVINNGPALKHLGTNVLLTIHYYITDDKGVYLFGGGSAYGLNEFNSGQGMQYDWVRYSPKLGQRHKIEKSA